MFDNEFFAVYGSKSNFFAVSNHVDELPLNELLDGSYNCPSLMREKGKGAENSSENFLSAVNKAFSVLRVEGPVQAQNSVDRENNFNQTPSVATVASPTSRNDQGVYSVNQPSANKLSFEDVRKSDNLVCGSLFGCSNALMIVYI